MAEVYRDPVPGAPEGCTHNCGTCTVDAGCDVSSKGSYGKFWKALDNFSRIDANELLDVLNSFGDEDKAD